MTKTGRLATTQYKCPISDSRGSRILVKVCGARAASYPYNYATPDPHAYALRMHLDYLGWSEMVDVEDIISDIIGKRAFIVRRR